MEYPSHQEIESIEDQLVKMRVDHWLQHDLFSFQWWFFLVLSIVPWIIWWKIVDKSRKQEIVFFGLYIIAIIMFLDVLGWNLRLWSYHVTLLPLCVPLLPINFTLLPVLHMLLYQYFQSWRSFLWMNIATALFFAYVAEPLLIRIEFYEMLHWKHIYSVPLYVGKSVLGKWMIQKLGNNSKHNPSGFTDYK